MDKNQTIKIIKKKTRGIYSDKFYSDLVDEILGVQLNRYEDVKVEYVDFFDKIICGKKYHSFEFVEIFNNQFNVNYSPKKVLMSVKEYVEHLGHVIINDRDVKGRYFIITRFEPK